MLLERFNQEGHSTYKGGKKHEQNFSQKSRMEETTWETWAQMGEY